MNVSDAITQRRFGTGRATRVDRWLLERLYGRVAPAPLRFVLWDGSSSGTRTEPGGTVVIRDRYTLAQLCLNADLYFGEAYMDGRLDVVAEDLGDALTVLYEGLKRSAGPTASPSAHGTWWARALSGSSPRRARANVHHHYDLGNDFYRRWLDDELLYTCAYYESPTASLDEAQRAKMELVCRKLDLRAGQRVVEAGCGWGALARYMARQYGVRVRAFNVSREQLAYAREAAAQEGLSDRVEFVEADYRMIDEPCDAFVSLGMLEHVGLRHFRALGGVMHRVLSPVGGRGLLHFIGRSRPAALNAWIRRRIFPGAYPPALSEVMTRVLEPYGFAVTDVENLRPHYARTLVDWRQRFDRSAAEIGRMFDQRFVRAWRLYLAGSEASFRTGSTELFQVVFTRPGAASAWTRHRLSAPMPAVGGRVAVPSAVSGGRVTAP